MSIRLSPWPHGALSIQLFIGFFPKRAALGFFFFFFASVFFVSLLFCSKCGVEGEEKQGQRDFGLAGTGETEWSHSGV